MKTKGSFHLLRLMVLAVVVGCVDQPSTNEPRMRSSDGLLADPELQAVVDLQVAGDAYGLTAALTNTRSEVRARALFALGSLGAAETVDAILPLLSDPEAPVRRDAAFALGRIGDPHAVAAVKDALAAEGTSEVRSALIEALGMLPSLDAADALLDLDVSGAENVERTYALARLGGSGTVASDALRARIVEDITHEDPGIRQAAAHYFRSPNNVGRWASRSLYLRLALDSYDKSDPAAAHLVRGLSRINDVLNASRLREWATEATDWRTRADAMPGMDPMSASAPTLIAALDDDDVNVAVAAAERLGLDAIPQSLADPIEEWLAASGGSRLGVAAPLLVQLAQLERTEAVIAWIEGIEPGDELRWNIAFETLSFLPGEAAILALSGALDDPSDRVAYRAATALSTRWGFDRSTPQTHDLYFEVFSQMASHRLTSVRRLAADGLSSDEFAGRAAVDVRFDEAEQPADPVRPTPPEEIDWSYLSGYGDHPLLELVTNRGTLTVRLVPEEAPLTVQTVIWLTEAGHYDGVPFHRVVPNFVVQGGDFTERSGAGEPGFATRVELTSIPFRRGVIGMANAGGRGSQGSQFMITHSRHLELDGAFTAFGWVQEGLDVLDHIELFDVVQEARIVPTPRVDQ